MASRTAKANQSLDWYDNGSADERGRAYNVAQHKADSTWCELHDGAHLVSLDSCNVADIRMLFAREFPGIGVTGFTRDGMLAALRSGSVLDAGTRGTRARTVGARDDATDETSDDDGTRIGRAGGGDKAGNERANVGHDDKADGNGNVDAQAAGDAVATAAMRATRGDGEESDNGNDAASLGTPSMGDNLEDRVRQIAREEDEARPLPAVEACAHATAAALTDVVAQVGTLQQRVHTLAATSELRAKRVHAIKVNDAPPVNLPDDAHPTLPIVAHMASQGCWPYLVGPAGTGKSFITEQAAALLGREHAFLSWGADTMTHELFGFIDANGNYHRTRFRDAWEFGWWFNNEEVDNGNAGLVTALNTALAGKRCAFPDAMVDRHANFVCSSCANTHGRGADRNYIGTNALNAAFLDRFNFVAVDYDHALEDRLVARYVNGNGHAAEVHAWVDRVRRTRDYCASNRIDFVMSMRASIDGAKLIASGMAPSIVENARILDRCNDADMRDTLAAL
jgi:hypothetical protein